jgi:peptide/nickel transport system substrate-binding protein
MVLLAAAAALAAASCGGGSSKGGGQGATNAALRYGYDLSAQFTNTFAPAKSTGDCDQLPMQQIYGQLVGKDTTTDTLDPALGFSQSWDLGPQRITLHLRPGLVFSNGEKLDASAVRTSLLNNKHNPQLTALTRIASVTAVDPLTVRIDLNQPEVQNVLYALANRDGMVVAPGHIADAGTNPVGAGPFRLSGYQQGARITLVPNPKFFAASQFHLAGVTFVQAAVGPPGVGALKAGDLDAVPFLLDSYASLSRDSRVGIASTPSGAYEQFQFRIAPGSPFAKLEVRQALEYAVDKQKLNAVVNDGLGVVTDQPFRKGAPGYAPSADGMYPYSPAKARQLLAAGGYPNGFTFTMVKPGGGIAFTDAEADTLVQMFRAVGVTAVEKPILGSDIGTQYYISRQGDAFAAEVLADPLPGSLLSDAYGPNQFVAVYSGREDKQVDTLARASLSTTDAARSSELAGQAAVIVMQKAYEIPLAFTPQLLAYDKAHVTGLRAPGNTCNAPDFRGVSVHG